MTNGPSWIRLTRCTSTLVVNLDDYHALLSNMADCECSGRKRLEQSGSDYGHHQTLRCHGNGERTDVKADNLDRHGNLKWLSADRNMTIW